MVLPEYLRSFSTDYSALQFFYSLAEGNKIRHNQVDMIIQKNVGPK